MNDSEIIVAAIEQAPVALRLSSGQYSVKPLTIRRMAKLAALLKDVQGNPADFRDLSAPAFNNAAARMLEAAGEKMPQALALLSGDDKLAALEDMSLLDLGALVEAAVKANQATVLMSTFRRAMEQLNGKADQK